MPFNGPRDLPPPPTASISYLPSTEADPFLAQSRDIALTERDRQEGYDVELLNARPRGAPNPRVEVEEGYPTYGAGKEDTGLTLGVETGGVGADEGRRTRNWFLRPLALSIIIGVVLAIALAIGLGVGLSEAHRRHRHEDDAKEGMTTTTTGSGGGGTRTKNATMINSEGTTAGTVVPNSLYSAYTSTAFRVTLTPSFSADSTATDVPPRAIEVSSSSVDVTSSSLPNDISAQLAPPTRTSSSDDPRSPASGTTLATTRNLPIPAGSSTIIGTVTLSSVRAMGATNRVRRRSWKG